MALKLIGANAISKILTFKHKSLQINLNDNIYGFFAETGAGLVFVRYFFRHGGASRSIA